MESIHIINRIVTRLQDIFRCNNDKIVIPKKAVFSDTKVPTFLQLFWFLAPLIHIRTVIFHSNSTVVVLVLHKNGSPV